MHDPPSPPVSSRSMLRFLWLLFVLLDGLVLLAAAAGYAAIYLDPRTFWWGELLAVALPALAVLLLVLTAVPVALRRWGWVALHAVVLVVLTLRLVPFERLERRGDPAPDDF